MEALRHDLSFAFRGLRRSPGLTIAIVVTLSLGVGANASVFTAIDRVYPSDLAIQRLSDLLAPQLRTWRIAAVLFLLFGALGLIAAATGIYGLVSYDVVQRSRDIGVRIALGATSGRVMRLVMGTGFALCSLVSALGCSSPSASGA